LVAFVRQKGYYFSEVMKMKFHEKLYQLRKGRKMSQEDLAEIVGVSRQAVQKWEAGVSNPDMDNLVAISKYFGVSVDSLIKEEEEAKAAQTEETREYVNYFPGIHYEYTSKKQLFGMPLVHVNVGWGMYKAKGVIAVGNIAVGLISLGILSMGVISAGALSLGLLALAALGLGGAVFAGVAAGILAVGGVAVGVFAIGGVAIGIYSMGGAAIAARIALGGVASGHIAIGDRVSGEFAITSTRYIRVDPETIRSLILQEYPRLWKPIVNFFTAFCNSVGSD
jgi:transcriptional regulator with XRE-family HTH domain